MMKKILFVFLLQGTGTLFAQKITCDNKLVEDAYKLAINTVDINTRRGVLAAGGDYGGEWTRDIAINSWNGVSLIRPAVAERSLWSVTLHKDTVGHQYWDKIIWVIAAYNHYLSTGDKAFLAKAYSCSANTMAELEQKEFDQEYGLFMGPSVFNDGIAGYPEPIYEPGSKFSGVFEHKNSKHIKCLSTNDVYYGAYEALYKMNAALNSDAGTGRSYQAKANALKQNIIKHLYNKDKNTFSYLIDHLGAVHEEQEGLGIAFAVMFGVVDVEQAKQLVGNAHVSKYGITSIYPDFPRYSSDKPGRHNNIIWPMVNGFFANAAVAAGDYAVFTKELDNLTHLALDEDKGNYNFWEIYNPYSGKPDGGYQTDGHWPSCRYQTWSATAYLNMVHNGLLGIRLGNNEIAFAPFLPQDIHSLELKSITYQQADLNISIKGSGSTIKSFLLDGKKQASHSVPAKLKGTHTIAIELE